MIIREEHKTWRTAFILTGLIVAYHVIQAELYLRDKAEKAYFWWKYRNFRYDE